MASGGSQAFLIGQESTFGTQAAGQYKTVRVTRGNVTKSKRAVQSQLIRGDRQTDANIQVFSAADAALSSELLAGDPAHNWLYENALFSSFDPAVSAATKGSNASQTGVTIASAGSNTFNFTGATSFITNDLAPGAWIAIDNVGGGADGWWKVATVADLDTITVETAGLSFSGVAQNHPGVVGSTGDEQYAYGFVRNGIIRRGLTIEHGFTDVTQYLRSIGCVTSTMRVALTAEQIGQVEFQFLGTSFASSGASADATPDAAATTSSISASTNVVRLFKDGTALGIGVRSLEFTVNNNVNQLSQIASATAADVTGGNCVIEGTLEAYFSDRTKLHDVLASHTALALEFVALDDQGGLFSVYLPRVNLMEGGVQPAGSNDPVTESYRISAVVGTAANENYMIQINSAARP